MTDKHIAPEASIARGLLARLALLAPLFLVVSWLVAGVHGLDSAGFGLALVALNFVLLWAAFREGARYGLVGVMTAAFISLLLGLAILTAATIPVVHAPWMNLFVFGFVVILGHLAAVVIEGRRVSGRLGDDGLRPWKVVR
ncbi:MAG: hypothetical protein ACYDHP_06305 [Ferrimicrobium sp.]